jgi:uncharacterized phage protein (TIGR02216 family)
MDWAGLLRAALGGLGITPEVFWRLTPVELRMMLGLAPGAAPLTRARLEELARAFPDGGADGGDRRPADAGGGAGGDGGLGLGGGGGV